MKHTLFLIHGMGRHEKDWWKEPWEQLCELSESYRYFKTRKLEDRVEPVGLRYDDHLVKKLRTWGEGGKSFADFAQTQQLQFADDVSWLAELPSDDPGFELTHVADVLMYRLFKLQAARIRDTVKHDVFKVVKERKKEDASARFSVVAHSLGTAVLHDALAEMGKAQTIAGHANTFQAGSFSFHALHMIANVSRLAQTEPRPYDSIVRPGDRDSSVTYCLRYRNYRHILDPFLLVRAFKPVGFGPRFKDIDLNHVHDWNVHGLSHYLANPRVHVPILNSLTRSNAIGRIEFGDAVEKTPVLAGPLEHVREFRDALAELGRLTQLIDEDEPLKANARVFREFWVALIEVRRIVEGVLQA